MTDCGSVATCADGMLWLVQYNVYFVARPLPVVPQLSLTERISLYLKLGMPTGCASRWQYHEFSPRR